MEKKQKTQNQIGTFTHEQKMMGFNPHSPDLFESEIDDEKKSAALVEWSSEMICHSQKSKDLMQMANEVQIENAADEEVQSEVSASGGKGTPPFGSSFGFGTLGINIAEVIAALESQEETNWQPNSPLDIDIMNLSIDELIKLYRISSDRIYGLIADTKISS